MDKQQVLFEDMGLMPYQQAWDYQEQLLKENVKEKSLSRQTGQDAEPGKVPTKHHLIFCEHNPVYTLGKTGKMAHLLMNEDALEKAGIEFYHTNRGGDITFHGPGQVVGYPIFDLEKFETDIGKYLRNLEEVIIDTLAYYHVAAERSKGETGVWIDVGKPGLERKICAMGVRCSLWITMHGFALNVNTDLGYFNNIIPCGIQYKQVTSLKKELGHEVNLQEIKNQIKKSFEKVFSISLQEQN
ncbi:MAG: lipoyl(octanoyl) transferase LipB [Ferruginibacter sp.]